MSHNMFKMVSDEISITNPIDIIIIIYKTRTYCSQAGGWFS